MERSFWTDLKCSICGREGSWPFIPFLEPGELVSGRPSDCAAVVVLDEMPYDVDLHPLSLTHFSVAHDTFCPDCYRIAESAEANGLDRDCFGGISLEDLNGTICGTFPVPTIPIQNMVSAFKGAHKFVPHNAVFDISNSSVREHLAYVFIPISGTVGEPVGLHLSFRFDVQWGQFMPEATPRMWLEAEWGLESDDLLKCSIWTADIPDEDRTWIFTLIFDFYYSVYKRMRTERSKAVTALKRSLQNYDSNDYKRKYVNGKEYATSYSTDYANYSPANSYKNLV